MKQRVLDHDRVCIEVDANHNSFSRKNNIKMTNIDWEQIYFFFFITFDNITAFGTVSK